MTTHEELMILVDQYASACADAAANPTHATAAAYKGLARSNVADELERLRAQMAQTPAEGALYGWAYMVNGTHQGFLRGTEPPPDDAYDSGTLVALYTGHPQPKGTQAVQSIPGWPLNYVHENKSEGTWEIGVFDFEDDRFSPVITVDTGIYYRPQDAEPMARLILKLLTATTPPTQSPAPAPEALAAHENAILERGIQLGMYRERQRAQALAEQAEAASPAVAPDRTAVMRQALDALQGALSTCRNRVYPDVAEQRPTPHAVKVLRKVEAAIPVLKDALASKPPVQPKEPTHD